MPFLIVTNTVFPKHNYAADSLINSLTNERKNGLDNRFTDLPTD
jgi:hypothetical protein